MINVIPPKLPPQQQKEARRRPEGATVRELAKSYNVGRGDDFEAGGRSFEGPAGRSSYCNKLFRFWCLAGYPLLASA